MLRSGQEREGGHIWLGWGGKGGGLYYKSTTPRYFNYNLVNRESKAGHLDHFSGDHLEALLLLVKIAPGTGVG